LAAFFNLLGVRSKAANTECDALSIERTTIYLLDAKSMGKDREYKPLASVGTEG